MAYIPYPEGIGVLRHYYKKYSINNREKLSMHKKDYENYPAL